MTTLRGPRRQLHRRSEVRRAALGRRGGALGPRTRYENLAWVGATSIDVEQRQLEHALELDPDVVTLVCGANDVLESVRLDARAYAERLGRMFARLREAPRAAVVTATYPDISRFLDLRPRTRTRVEEGMRCSTICRGGRAAPAVALDGFRTWSPSERGTYADDGFHPRPRGPARGGRLSCARCARGFG